MHLIRTLSAAVTASCLLLGGVAPALAADGGTLPDATAYNLSGQPVQLRATATDINVLVFVDTLCPISNRYAPELARLASDHGDDNVHFWIVYPNGRLEADEIRTHMQDYALPGIPLIDRSHALVGVADVAVTPEAAVFRGTERLYHGRVDDRFTGFGSRRARAREHELDDAIVAARDGRQPEKMHEPFVGAGCFIADFRNGEHDHGADSTHVH